MDRVLSSVFGHTCGSSHSSPWDSFERTKRSRYYFFSGADPGFCWRNSLICKGCKRVAVGSTSAYCARAVRSVGCSDYCEQNKCWADKNRFCVLVRFYVPVELVKRNSVWLRAERERHAQQQHNACFAG